MLFCYLFVSHIYSLINLTVIYWFQGRQLLLVIIVTFSVFANGIFYREKRSNQFFGHFQKNLL